jgi:tetratricopeptide (TPR) repeat protein
MACVLLAALGRLDNALESLQLAVELAGDDAAPAVRAKARLSLAWVWLTLGRADLVLEGRHALPTELMPGMQMQAMWLQARAAEQLGRSAQKHWTNFAQLESRHPDLPLVVGAAFEVSYLGEPQHAIERLARARAECGSLGLPGMARALAWRELARWLELPGEEATTTILALADDLVAHVETGLSAKCYPPDVWVSLAAAYERVGNTQRQVECLQAGRAWLTAAVARLAPAHRSAFSTHNQTNRILLARADLA